MAVPNLRQRSPEELDHITELLRLTLMKWREWSAPPPGQIEASWAGLTPRQAWMNGYAAGYADCAEGLEFGLNEILDGTD